MRKLCMAHKLAKETYITIYNTPYKYCASMSISSMPQQTRGILRCLACGTENDVLQELQKEGVDDIVTSIAHLCIARKLGDAKMHELDNLKA